MTANCLLPSSDGVGLDMGAVVLGVLRRARVLDKLMQHDLYSMSGPY
jgi:hypothetical protein